MQMTVEPLPNVSDRINEIRALTARIVNEEILPNENMLWHAHSGDAVDPADLEEIKALRSHIRETVQQAGLWAPHLPEEYGGAGLDFLELAYMNEILAYGMAAALFGVVAPNSGNQSILVKYGTAEQREKWLLPLVEGRMESGFSMTEPDQPGSDPRSLRTTARRDGDEWVIDGHKWFTSNGLRADFFIVMCRTEDPDGPADQNGKMTQIIVPSDTPACTSSGGSTSGAVPAITARSATRTSGSPPTINSVAPDQVIRPRRTGSVPGASTTA